MAFNRFQNKAKKNSWTPGQQNQQMGEIVRVRLPRDKEVLGILEQRMGASRIMIKCFDGKSRNCRVPGRLKKKLWLREGDVVLVEPWEFDNDRGDVIFKYTPAAIEWLKKKGYINEISEF